MLIFIQRGTGLQDHPVLFSQLRPDTRDMVSCHPREDAGQVTVHDGQAGGEARRQHVGYEAVHGITLLGAFPSARVHIRAVLLGKQGVTQELGEHVVINAVEPADELTGKAHTSPEIFTRDHAYAAVSHLVAYCL